MGSIKGLNKWNQQGIKDISFQQNNFYYFTRKMAVCASCMEPYFSHIFIKVYQTQRELEENWKEVMYYIALKYQSKLEKMIENPGQSGYNIGWFNAKPPGCWLRGEAGAAENRKIMIESM